MEAKYNEYPPQKPSQDGELLALLKGLFAWYIAQNWALRLFPVLLGMIFYDQLKDTGLVYFLWVQGAIELLKAINLFLYNANITVIQVSYLKANLSALFGFHQDGMQVRKPDADYSQRGANANANANANIFSGGFLQKKLEERLLATGEGRELANPKTPKSLPISQPTNIAFLRYDVASGQDVYNIDGTEYSRRDIIKRAGAYRTKSRENPTERNLLQTSYWTFCKDFVNNSEQERKNPGGGASFEIVGDVD